MLPPTQPDILPDHPPVVPIPQDPFLPTSRLRRLVARFPRGQFLRYLAVGCFNTAFGYTTYALLLALLNRTVPQRFLALTVIAASLLSTPINITVAYFGYKFFVFRTQGNYLAEWLKCFAVYGVGQIPGLLALSALTRLLQANLGHPRLAGYLAGAVITLVSTLWSFVGHRRFTFRSRA